MSTKYFVTHDGDLVRVTPSAAKIWIFGWFPLTGAVDPDWQELTEEEAKIKFPTIL